jgi:hypothetical protein
MIDPNLTPLLEVDPEALAWLATLAFACGADAAEGNAPIPIADERVAGLLAGVAAAWAKRRSRTAWLSATIEATAALEPWPEETV